MKKGRKGGKTVMEFEQIIQLIKTISSSEVTGFELEEGSLKIAVKKREKRYTGESVLIEQSEKMQGMERNKEETEDSVMISSPLVGTFYASPDPEAPPFVSVGDKVKAGQVIGIIEAMKLMNEVEAEFDGKIEKILVENEQVIEYGQPLFMVKPERR
jgi:acetyl-CoA carboxylase biotin carboxyl carrier protein